MRIQDRTTPIVFIVMLISVSALTVMTDDQRYVAAPGFACFILFLWLWMKLWDRDHQIPFFDIGVFTALATLVYAVYPLMNYWVDGLKFGLLGDHRLRQYSISPDELGFFHLRHVLYLFSFVVSYSMFRGRGNIVTGNVDAPRRSTRQVIIVFFLLLTGYFIFLQIMTGVNYNASYETVAFAKNLTALSRLPLPLLQISGRLQGISFVFKLALLFIVISRCREKKWLVILLLWITVEIIQTFIIKGGRRDLVLFFIAAALLHHRIIKPISMKFLITGGLSLFSFFIFLGLYRTYTDFASLQVGLSHANAGIFSGNNEFQAMLGTAYDVLQRKEAGADLPYYLYINDFIKILPPQQIMPFEKIGASEWYLREIGMSGTGRGYMWGVITQSIVGFDWIELALRGAILGYILGKYHRWYLKRQYGFLATLIYIFFCLNVYYTFRDTTFSLLANLVWQIIPFYIILRLGVTILPRKVVNEKEHSTTMAYYEKK